MQEFFIFFVILYLFCAIFIFINNDLYFISYNLLLNHDNKIIIYSFIIKADFRQDMIRNNFYL